MLTLEENSTIQSRAMGADRDVLAVHWDNSINPGDYWYSLGRLGQANRIKSRMGYEICLDHNGKTRRAEIWSCHGNMRDTSQQFFYHYNNQV